jgi:hypothetical protein
MSYCPEGTDVRRYYGGLVVALILDIAMIVLYVFLRKHWEPVQVLLLPYKQYAVRAHIFIIDNVLAVFFSPLITYRPANV